MHKNAAGHTREEIVKQVKIKNRILWKLFKKKGTVGDYELYIPVGNAVKKLNNWKKDGAEILYLTSRKKTEEIKQIQNVLKKYTFPKGKLFFRKEGEEYKDVAERIMPNVLIEDDCESIGGKKEMTYTHINEKAKKKIKLVVVKEFGGIDHLPDKINKLIKL